MPLPSPFLGETRPAFIERCVDADVMIDEFPDEGDRLDACELVWQRRPGDPEPDELAALDTALDRAIDTITPSVNSDPADDARAEACRRRARLAYGDGLWR